MKLAILFHDNCFDGLASAGLFHAFAARHLGRDLRFVFGGLAHSPPGDGGNSSSTGALGPARLIGDVNAVVDFRYIADERLHWWFDHHKSAFATEEDRRHFEQDVSGKKYFDPSAPSCAGFLAAALARDHGFEHAEFQELIRWADIIDSARFSSPRMAVELKEPALRLMTWIENSTSFDERTEVILRLTREPLGELVKAPFISKGLEPLLERHWRTVEAVKKRHRLEGAVVWCDMTDEPLLGMNKFTPYHLQPNAKYAVIVTRSDSRSKVSVGYNPWAPAEEREHDIASLCERYGGGGHAVVGAISLARDQAGRAVAIGREIVETLNRER